MVLDVAVLSAVGVRPDGTRSVLGVSVELSEAQPHWRRFLEGLVARGMTGLTYVVSDDHAGLKAARRAVLPSVPWQRCQFHLQQNAAKHCPNRVVQAQVQVHEGLRDVFTANTRVDAEARLQALAAGLQEKHPKLSGWLEENAPEGLTVFMLPACRRKKMRTSNGIEKPIQQELKRRTRKIRVFPNAASLLRLSTAILVEIDDTWSGSGRRYLIEPADAEPTP